MGSLFAGIGGFDLGFERAGMEIKWQVEIDPYCRKVLERHFPNAERFGDIRECCGHDFCGIECPATSHLEPVDVICGGFPCQDISSANHDGKGLQGERSGLWFQMLRITGELRPEYLVVENVANLFVRGFADVIGGLAEIGYDAEWNVIPAYAVGAPHRRNRVWIVAYPGSQRRHHGRHHRQGRHILYNLDRASAQGQSEREGWLGGTGAACEIDTDAEGYGVEGQQVSAEGEVSLADAIGILRYASSSRLPDWAGGEVGQPRPLTEFERPDGREIERDFRGVAYGVRNRVDRLRGLGNSIVPQIAQWIGERIMEAN